RRIDPILPAGAVLLEEIEHVTVDAQRYLFLGVGDRRLRCRQLGGLGGRRLEGRLGGIARIARSTWSVGHGSSLIGLIPGCATRPGRRDGCRHKKAGVLVSFPPPSAPAQSPAPSTPPPLPQL